jgi:hypothetical protein
MQANIKYDITLIMQRSIAALIDSVSYSIA